MQNNFLDNIIINNFFINISGIFKYDINQINNSQLVNDFCIWSKRINNEDYKKICQHIENKYYDSYIHNAFPEMKNDQETTLYKSSNLTHLTKKTIIDDSKKFSLNIKDNILQGIIPYIDIFLFPGSIGIFSIRFEITVPEILKLQLIAEFTKQIRNPDIVIKIQNEQQTLKQFVEKEILNNIITDKRWDKYNPLFKIYTIIELHNGNLSSKELDELLYDIGNVSGLGSASGIGEYAPSESYFNEQMRNNRISVFKNWSALCLFDTFTRISLNQKDFYKNWEYDYFTIYIYTLYIKSFMYHINTEVSDIARVSKKTGQLKNKFITFINEYYLSHISYKFLPNLLYNKWMYAMEVRTEIDKMELKIQRINNFFQKKREIVVSKALTILSFLGIFAVIYYFSSWMEKLGISHNWLYPYGSISFLLIIIAVLSVIFFIHKKNDNTNI